MRFGGDVSLAEEVEVPLAPYPVGSLEGRLQHPSKPLWNWQTSPTFGYCSILHPPFAAATPQP